MKNQEPTKGGHGGAREGAGRKSEGGFVRVGLSVSPETVKKADDLRAALTEEVDGKPRVPTRTEIYNRAVDEMWERLVKSGGPDK